MADDSARLELKFVRTSQGSAAAKRMALEAEGWEFVREKRGRLRTELVFHRPKPKRQRRLLVGLSTLLILALLAGGAIAALRLVGRPATDSDKDGIPDRIETSGWRTEAGEVYKTDRNDGDSDNDGLTDGEEAGRPSSDTAKGRTVFAGLSNPQVADTDGDGLQDIDEFALGTSLQRRDTDADGLDDRDEIAFGSDPVLANPDKDTYTDEEEAERESDPFDHDLSEVQLAIAKGALTAISLASSLIPGSAIVKYIVRLAKLAKLGPAAWRTIRGLIDRSPMAKKIKEKVLKEVSDRAPWSSKEPKDGPKKCAVYLAVLPGGSPAYVGISLSLKKLKDAHGGAVKIDPIDGADGLSRVRCSHVAEAILVRGGLKSTGGVFANTVHAVGPDADDYDDAVEYGEELLEKIDFHGPTRKSN